MTLAFYGLKNCDTCKKAMKALDQAGVAFNFKDIRSKTPGPEQLLRWLATAGEDRLVNKRSTTWRNLDPAERNLENNEVVVSLLSNHPTLIKRPVIEDGDEVYVGWSKSEEKALLNKDFS
ncbi:MAG: Spx/MgsR family RNA polymerase-binding regulatory protein [Pseudomonadota bacterium]